MTTEPTAAAMRAAKAVDERGHHIFADGTGYDPSVDELARIIDTKTHLPELLKVCNRACLALHQIAAEQGVLGCIDLFVQIEKACDMIKDALALVKGEQP